MVYVRQSSVVQVRVHGESTARQYGLAATAVELGWAPGGVLTIDADLGVSGRFGAHRDGFTELLARVCRGEVGAIFGLEVSRLARSSGEFARLLELARLTDTLLVDADGVYDLSNVNDRLLLGLKGSMSEAELHLLTGRLHGAKLAAAHRGELRSPLAVGYVHDDSEVIIDPDQQVRQAVQDLFAEFAATGSAMGVVKAFAADGRLFPQRKWGGVWDGQIKWGTLTHSRVLQAVKNPVYAGAYAYGRSYDTRTVRPDGTVTVGRVKRARAEWTVLIRDHHPGYITWQQFLDIEAKLAANHTKAGFRPPREGPALCQGIMFCGRCGGRMTTRYGDGGRVHYLCQRRDPTRTTTCRTVAAVTVDDAVCALLLDAVTPHQLHLAVKAADELTDRHTRSHRAAELAVERARYEADRAERAFSHVDPANRLVARTLESKWEAKLVALADAEATLATTRAARPPLPERDALLALAADLPRLWHHPDTQARDRKRLLRTLIADVTLLPEQHTHEVRIGVRWHTGATDEITAGRIGPGRTPTAALKLIRRHGATHTSDQLAVILNAEGLRTGRGHRWTKGGVARVRDAYTIHAPRTAAIQNGETSVKQAAAELGIPADAVYNWLRLGQVPARRGPSGRWCIPWDTQTQAIYQRKVAASFRLKPNPTRNGERAV